MGIEVKSWTVQPDIYDLTPVPKNGVALQAYHEESQEVAGRMYILPEAIAITPVICVASGILKTSAAIRSALRR